LAAPVGAGCFAPTDWQPTAKKVGFIGRQGMIVCLTEIKFHGTWKSEHVIQGSLSGPISGNLHDHDSSTII